MKVRFVGTVATGRRERRAAWLLAGRFKIRIPFALGRWLAP